MDLDIFGWISLALVFLWFPWAMVSWHHRFKEAVQLPPGPRRWPVVGNIHRLRGELPHISITKLARQYGPIMTLWLGSMCTVVISTHEVAREMFKNHDVELAGRKIYESMKGNYNVEGSIITSQYGSHWRSLRRLCTTEMFTGSRLEALKDIRRKCVDQMVESIREASAFGTNSIDLARFFLLFNYSLIGNLVFSKDLLDKEPERGARFFYHAGKVIEFAGKPNAADFVPILKNFDLQGIKHNTQFHVEHALQPVRELIKDRIQSMENGNIESKDYLDVILKFQGDGIEESSRFSSTVVTVIVFEMFTAGTDTTTSTLEWVMAELLNHPTILKKVQAELRSTIGPGKKVEEKDIENLPYLNSVVKETLRLHPPLPFLVPRLATKSCTISGYKIPKETQILVNAWAIGRDPNSWVDPLVFKPERFLEERNKTDYKGQHFEYIPFGSGRRICPAVSLASRLLPLVLGSLLHSFDWRLPDGLKPEDMDKTERMTITLRKSVPLTAVPIPYKN